MKRKKCVYKCPWILCFGSFLAGADVLFELAVVLYIRSDLIIIRTLNPNAPSKRPGSVIGVIRIFLDIYQQILQLITVHDCFNVSKCFPWDTGIRETEDKNLAFFNNVLEYSLLPLIRILNWNCYCLSFYLEINEGYSSQCKMELRSSLHT